MTEVEKDGTLRLGDGAKAALEGIRLPGADDPLSPVAAKALETLRQLTQGALLTLTAMAPESDRYGRLRVQAFDHVWLAVALLEQGLARVEIAPDRDECAPDLYEAEAKARASYSGLWALPRYAVQDALALSPTLAGRFEVVEGQVENVGVHEGRAFLDFQEDYRRGFSAFIAPEDRKAFRKLGFALEDLVGRRIRLRGVVQNFEGRPEIALSNPYQIEILN